MIPRPSSVNVRNAPVSSILGDAAPLTPVILLHQVIEQRFEPNGRVRPLAFEGAATGPAQSVLDLDPLLLPRVRVRPAPRRPVLPPVWEEPDPREDRLRRLRQVAVWAAGIAGGAAAFAGALMVGM